MTAEGKMRNAVFIEAARSGYHPSQCSTMTVGELVAFLDEFDPEAPIYISNDNGYTYGGIWYDSVLPAKFDEEIVEYEEW